MEATLEACGSGTLNQALAHEDGVPTVGESLNIGDNPARESQMEIPLILLAVLSTAVEGADPCQRVQEPANAYQQFIQRPPAERATAFERFSADKKACMKRLHAVRWLEQSGQDLSASQVAAVREAINFVTPEIYTNPDDPVLVRREGEVKANLACQIGRQQAQAAFSFHRESTSSSSGVGLFARWLERFSDCYLR